MEKSHTKELEIVEGRPLMLKNHLVAQTKTRDKTRGGSRKSPHSVYGAYYSPNVSGDRERAEKEIREAIEKMASDGWWISS